MRSLRGSKLEIRRSFESQLFGRRVADDGLARGEWTPSLGHSLGQKSAALGRYESRAGDEILDGT